jgi:hypothetical protein
MIWGKFTDVLDVFNASVMIIAMIIQAVKISETSANVYQTTRLLDTVTFTLAAREPAVWLASGNSA